MKFFPIIFLLSLFLNIHSQYVTIRANDLESYCETNLYKIIINVEITESMKEYISFYLNAYSSEKSLDILFKCMIDPKKNQIICITNLQQYKITLDKDDSITLPYPFPEVKGIRWDYNTFLFMIFRRTIRLDNTCGESVLKSKVSKLDTSKWDLIAKINKIYGGQCLLSDTKDNFYSFSMNLTILGGNLKDKMDELDDDTGNTQIIFMQNITMPFMIGPMTSLIKGNNFKSDEYYKMAFCYPLYEINTTNYIREEGIDFHCDIPISEQYIFNGPLKISTFSDNIYAKISSEVDGEKIDIISIYFTTEKDPLLKDNIEDFKEGEKGEEDDDEDDEDDDDDFTEDKEEEKQKENEKEEEENNIDNDEEDEEIGNKKDYDNNDKEEEEEINVIKEDLNKNEENSINIQNLNKQNIPIINNPSKSSPSIIEYSSSSSSSSSLKSSSSSNKSSFLGHSSSGFPISSSSKSSLSSSSNLSSQKSSSANPSGVLDSTLSDLNLRGLQKEKKKKNYLLLDNRKSNFICPDKPIFEIIDIENGISYEPIPNKKDKYSIILKGHLKNGYKINEKKIIPLEYTSNDINFNLSITNNLVEEISDKKKYIPCYLSAGTFFDEEEPTKIKCIIDKMDQKQNENSDITINWASKENKYLNNILIKWPKDLTIHSKKLYSYNIKALSIKKTDHDCFDDKYYFYINIIDLKSEPKISFDINMLSPNSLTSHCKLYTSNMLKCFLDLKLKRISEGSNIKLQNPGNYNITTLEGNFINFTIMDFSDDNETGIADEGIYTDQTCGRYKIVGAVQNIGYNHFSAVAIIISFLIILFVVLLGIGLCVTYEITHRDKKGKYFAHVEEKKDKNNTNSSVNQFNVSVQK